MSRPEVSPPSLAAELARAEAMIRAAIDGTPCDRSPIAPPHRGLATIAARFQLEPVERDVLALVLAVELSPACATRFEQLAGVRGHPTVAAVAAALAAGADTVIAALVPGAHLARSGLVETIGDGPFPLRTVRVPESVWPRIVDLPARLPFPSCPRGQASLDVLELAPSTRAQAARVVARAGGPDADRALVVVSGPPARGPEVVATALAGALDLGAVFVPAASVDDPAALAAIRREALWAQAAVIVQGAPTPAGLARLATELASPIVVVTDHALEPDRCAAPGRWRLDVEVAPLPPEQRVAIWRRHLGVALAPGVTLAPELDLPRLVEWLRFDEARIAVTAALAAERARERDGVVRADDVRAATRTAAPRPSGLARRLDAEHAFADLVVPAATQRELGFVTTWARHACALRGPAAGTGLRTRGGLVCLFYGAPGTGKTLAAQAISNELGLALLRVDLSQVVNKYIGETEKNLDRVFDEAEAAGAILFFDEADALFGKRTEVKDAHDRYSNIETAFLLQRLEVHSGLCILASNLQQNLDVAFTRRIQIIAEFPLPGPAERALIWDRHLVRAHLADDVELAELGNRFALTGGDIRNAATTAVLLAAADQEPIAMRHLVIGVWREIKKSGRLVSADDFGPWRKLVAAYVR